MLDRVKRRRVRGIYSYRKNEMTTFQCNAVSRINLKSLRNCGKMRSAWTNDTLPSISFNAYSAMSSNTSAVMPNRRQSLLIFLVLLQLTGKTLDNCNITDASSIQTGLNKLIESIQNIVFRSS